MLLNIIKKKPVKVFPPISLKKNEDFFLSKIEKSKKESAKHFPSSIREWNNSIFSFDKSNLNLIPSTTVKAFSIIKSFFFFFNRKLENKLRTKRLLLRLKRLSSNKIYISKGEYKHNNNKVLINLYIYNRQKSNYLNRLKKIYLSKKNQKFFKLNLIKILKKINKKVFFNLKKINYNKYLIVKALTIVKKNKNYPIHNFKNLNYYCAYFYKKLIFRFMKKFRLYYIYKQLIYLNKSKLNYTYLRLLKKYLEILYKKNVEFNLINLKRFFLNSDILSEAIKLKLIRTRNVRKVFKKIKKKIKIGKEKNSLNLFAKNGEENEKKVDFFLNNLKYRHVTGFRLQAKGRLSRRYTASRSISRVEYAGNLMNFDSSYHSLSSVLLKGNLKSNLQYTKLNCKTRVGSFGLKGWVSGN